MRPGKEATTDAGRLDAYETRERARLVLTTHPPAPAERRASVYIAVDAELNNRPIKSRSVEFALTRSVPYTVTNSEHNT